jgi:hypothetical protein
VAVTQQLVRITPANLTRCMHGADALRRLVSRDTSVVAEDLDLDWIPVPLERALTEIGLSDGASTVASATAGMSVLNEAFPDGPPDDPVWEGPVRFVPPEEVDRLASKLGALDATALARASATCSTLDRQGIRGGGARYLAKGLRELAEFYARAAEAGDAVATWWD